MILAHDLGTTGDKATLVDDQGALVDSVTVSYGADFAAGGKAEQDPAAWWDAFRDATRVLLARSGVTPSAIDAVTFSGQMMGVVLVDRDDEPVRPAIIWADTRATRQAERLVAEVGMDRGYRITGHRLNASYSLSKLAWVRDNEPEAFDRADAFLLPKDYLITRLTGVRVTDPSDASGTNAYDQGTGTWSDELLDAAGIRRSLFPTIVESTAVAGRITPTAARETGLMTGTPVVVGGGDGPMAALGAGIIDPASGAYAYLGSSSWVSVSAPRPLHDPLMRSMTFNHVVPGQFVPTATMQAGGASLQWITSVLSPGRDDRYEEVLASAVAPAAEDGLYFLPHLLGERSPWWNPRARAAFVGLLLHHGRGNMARAVLEGVAFNLLAGLHAFRDGGVDVRTIEAIGGAAHADLLLQIFADVWGVSVSSRQLVDEATSIGAAVVGGVGIGLFPDFTAGRSLSRSTAVFEPDGIRSAAYDRAYPLFIDAYKRLEGWFDSVASV